MSAAVVEADAHTPRPTQRAQRRRLILLGAAALVALAALLIAHLALGRAALSPVEVWDALRGNGDAGARQIVIGVRAPRGVVAVLAGALLAVAGALLQAITRNELADPGLLGVGPAGVLAVVVALVATGGGAPRSILALAALTGALCGGGLVYALGWRDGSDPLRIILTGVLVATVCSALTTMLLLRSGDALGAVFRWVIGSLHARTWEEAQLIAIGALVSVLMLVVVVRMADLLQLGDDVARGRGLAVGWARGAVFVTAATATAFAVAVTGALGFLGLVAPHITRRLVGPGVGVLVVGSALVGALLLVGADVVATTLTVEVNPRGATQRAVLPVGALTAAIGAAFLMRLLARESTR